MRCNRWIRNFLMALAAVVTYDMVSNGFMIGVSVFYSVDVLEDHYFMLDTISTAFLMALFLFWLYQIERKDKKKFLSCDTFQNMYWAMAFPIIGLGLSALSGIWLTWAELNLQDIAAISESLESFDETWSTLGREAYIWELLSIVIIGPIVEELLFRGVVFHYFEKIRSGWFPIIFSALAFGIWHQEPVQVVYTAMIGIAYGMIYSKVRDLRITIILHMINNFLSTLPPMLDTPAVQESLWKLSYWMMIPSIALIIQLWCQPSLKEENL